MSYQPNPVKPSEPLLWTGAIAAIVFILAAVCFGLVFIVGAVSRYQSRADASNGIQVQERQLKVAHIAARIRYQQSIGIRRSQDEIAKTLTPLYVAFEMTQAMQSVATSGKNNTVIYLPTNPANGLPIVPTNNTPSGAVVGGK